MLGGFEKCLDRFFIWNLFLCDFSVNRLNDCCYSYRLYYFYYSAKSKMVPYNKRISYQILHIFLENSNMVCFHSPPKKLFAYRNICAYHMCIIFKPYKYTNILYLIYFDTICVYFHFICILIIHVFTLRFFTLPIVT